MLPNDTKDWSLDYALGYQAGFLQGMEVHANSLETLRQAQKDFYEALDVVLSQGNAEVVARLDEIILNRIEHGDTPNKH